jgi:beta-barrel assembly-enhancing protease
MKRIALAMAILTGVTVVGCKTLETATRAVTTVGVVTGRIDAQQAEAINKTTAAFAKAFENITPEQEYYLGRAVAASLFRDNRPFDNAAAAQYLNLLGTALALASDQPETFAGYRFAIMETEAINAFAAPGGFILLSRGLLRCCPNEDAVAAVLAHEIAHVQHRHGLRAIKTSRWTDAAQTAFVESAKTLGSAEVAQLTNAMEGSIDDITQKLVVGGYSRKQEFEADRSAIEILQRVGYSPHGLRVMLEQMDKLMPPDAASGFGKTHPSATARLEAIAPLLKDAAPVAVNAVRDARCSAALAGIR